jgi:hypothetical protein
VVARARQHRRRERSQQFGRLPVLGRQAVVGDVAGQQYRVDRAGKAGQVVDHGRRAPAGGHPVALTDMHVGDVREDGGHGRLATSSPGATFVPV